MFDKLKDVYTRLGNPRLCNPFKRRVSIVYRSKWLHGTYVFTFKSSDRDVYDAWMDQIVQLVAFEPKAHEVHFIRADPGIDIVEIF